MVVPLKQTLPVNQTRSIVLFNSQSYPPEIHWVAAESLDAALRYMRQRNDDFNITEAAALWRQTGHAVPPREARETGSPAWR
jgi:hypothetical protein